MNNVIFSLTAIFIISIFVLGCHEHNNSTEGQVRTENEFLNDPSQTANPEKDLVVMLLEPPDALPEENQTGEIGEDVFTFRYKKSVNHAFCWEDNDGEAGHFIELDDTEGNEIFRLDVNGECITVLLEAGDYLMHIHHDGMIERTLPIFVIPVQEDLEQADDSSDGFIIKGRLLISNTFQYLLNVVTQNVNAQSAVERNVRTVIRTNACSNCDLAGADLTGADLTGANLAGADLTGADLTQANLTGANLFQTNLVGALLNGADLTLANIVAAILRGATLTDAYLPGTNLSAADLTAAIWCDDNVCLAGSTGICETGERHIDNCDGTITDTDTNLVWEKKDSPGGGDSICPGAATCDNPHDVDNRYAWSSTGVDQDGPAFTDFLEKLNNGCNNDPTVNCSVGGFEDCINSGVGGCCGFACQRDWRLPEVAQEGGPAELESILDLSEGICGGGNGACINPIFGPTATTWYWSATTIVPDPIRVWSVNFSNGNLGLSTKDFFDDPARAVRP